MLCDYQKEYIDLFLNSCENMHTYIDRSKNKVNTIIELIIEVDLKIYIFLNIHLKGNNL